MKKRKIKKYTVNTVRPIKKKKSFKIFQNLKEARAFAREQFRANNFVSLLNGKDIPLPI